MIHSYDQDEVVSTEEIWSNGHSRDCHHSRHSICAFRPTYCRFLGRKDCTGDHIRGTRIVIEKWDEYPIKVDGKK